MNGEAAMTTRASRHEKKKQIAAEIVIPSAASVKIPAASVVSPFTAAMSSYMMFVRIPGAFSLSSNQPISFRSKDSKSFTLNL